jgi:selenocysteine lyase/cysteine desulfurase
MNSNNKTLNIQDIYRLEEEIDTIINEEINKAKEHVKERTRQLIFNISQSIPRLKTIDINNNLDINFIVKNQKKMMKKMMTRMMKKE